MERAIEPGKQLSVGEAINYAKGEMQSISDSASMDAQVLLAHILEVDRAWLLAHPEQKLTEDQINVLEADIERMKQNVPLPYIIGKWEFFGLSFFVTPDVLIPRPETELLVESAISWLKQNPDRSKILDVGTGTGCIAVSIATSIPSCAVLASDISEQALAVAAQNVKYHQLQERISLQQADLLSGIEGEYDVVCANLPYIPTVNLVDLDVYHREPTLALDGGEHGLRLISKLLESLATQLTSGALVLLEIESSQADSSFDLAAKQFPNASTDVLSDLSGKPRLLRLQT